MRYHTDRVMFALDISSDVAHMYCGPTIPHESDAQRAEAAITELSALERYSSRLSLREKANITSALGDAYRLRAEARATYATNTPARFEPMLADLEKAHGYYMKILERYPERARKEWRWLAHGFVATGDAHRALVLMSSVEQGQRNEQFHRLLADILYSMGQVTAAAAEYGRWISAGGGLTSCESQEFRARLRALRALLPRDTAAYVFAEPDGPGRGLCISMGGEHPPWWD